jgi:ABC-type transport system involved in cytochrome c biogenesis permease component
MLTDNPLEDEDFGFPPAKQRRDRPRLRLALTIVVTVIGFLIAAATVLVFLGIHDYAISSLSSALGVGTSAIEVSGAFPGTGSVGTRGATAS